jgi:hypothetical protein
MSVDLQTALAAEKHRAEVQCLEEQQNVIKLRMFQAGTRAPAPSNRKGQHLALL